jgi:hypothetical protein
MLAAALQRAGVIVRTSDSFAVTLRGTETSVLTTAMNAINAEECQVPLDRRLLAELKFGDCLPEKLAEAVLKLILSTSRLCNCLGRPRRWIGIASADRSSRACRSGY